MRSCRQITLEDIGGSHRRFLVDTSAEPAALRQLTEAEVVREPLGDDDFLWVDVGTTPGAAILLGTDRDHRRGAVATRVDLDALGADPLESGVVRLRSAAEYWLPCCGAGIDACLAFNRGRCSLALEHLLDADELLPIPPLAPSWEPRPPAGRALTVGGERWEVLHCAGLVLVGGGLWSLWSDCRGAPRSWELHQGGAGVAESVRTPRYAREHISGHVTVDGAEVDLRFPRAADMEALCRPYAFGARLLDA
jgi:hypothetical protein